MRTVKQFVEALSLEEAQALVQQYREYSKSSILPENELRAICEEVSPLSPAIGSAVLISEIALKFL